MVYDSLGRNTQRTDTFGDVTKTDYDRAGNAVKQTDAKNKYTLISFDSRNRRKSTTDRISAGTNFAYTALSQLASLTDAESQATVYTYDARGSKLTEQYPDHVSSSAVGTTGYGIVTFVYDNAGRVQRKQDQAGDTCSYNFDLAGRMTSRNYRTLANSPSGTITDTDTFTFDRSGRMLTADSGRYNNTVGYAFDPVGRKASESLTIASQTYTVGSEFNARNELVKYTYPDSSIANRAYNARGGLSELKLDSSVIDTRSYDDGGRMTTDVLGNGITETRAYRTDNLLSSISFSNTNIGNLTYSWDANKNKTAETIGGVMSGYGFTSAGTAYDDEDRLTGYQQASTNFNQSWALTSVGDWSSVTTNGTAVTRTHGPTHELLTSGGQNVTTDVKGNQTVLSASLATQAAQLAFAWDYDNKLKSSDIDNNGSADVTFEYDALGRRVARTEGSTAVVYFQADQQTIADYPRGGAASTATYRYVFGSYIDEPVVRKTAGTGGTVLYYHRNQQYSIYALTDSSGAVSERYAYTAYGQPTFLNASATVQTSSAANNRYMYTAREWDATLGLHHFRARWMSGLTGRFLTRDPIGYEGGYQLYSLQNQFAQRRVDPLGEQAEEVGSNVIVISPKPGATIGNLSCGQTAVEDYDYTISNGAPCGGWLVQKITVCCKANPCKPNCKCDEVSQEQMNCKSYWEAWHFKKGEKSTDTGKAAKWPATDRSSFPAPGNTCGRYWQFGEARYFCNNWRFGSSNVNYIVSNWRNGVSVAVGDCPTVSSGSLKGTTEQPRFWTDSPHEIADMKENEFVEANYRGMDARWKCCGGDDDFFFASTFNGSSNHTR